MRSMGMPYRRVALVTLSASLVTLSCGAPSPVVPQPSPAITAPVPTPLPTPTPTPTPVTQQGCPIGKGSVDADCAKGSPRLLAALEGAIDRLVKTRPELFNLQEEAGANTGQYRVLGLDTYLDGLVDTLRASGHCAERSLDLERILVKSSNELSEEWDVLTANGFIRRGPYAYQKSCTPAAFPGTRVI